MTLQTHTVTDVAVLIALRVRFRTGRIVPDSIVYYLDTAVNALAFDSHIERIFKDNADSNK
jgi:hypothetical protein